MQLCGGQPHAVPEHHPSRNPGRHQLGSAANPVGIRLRVPGRIRNGHHSRSGRTLRDPHCFRSDRFRHHGLCHQPDHFHGAASGAYVVSGQLNWDRGPVGTRTVTVFDGATPILTASTPPVTAVPVTLPFVEMINLTEGDILTVVGTHDQLTAQNVLPGSIFTVVLYLPNASPAPVVVPTSNGTRTFVADADMPALTAIYVTADGGVYPIDPTTVTINGSSLSPPFAYDMYPFIDGVTLTPANTGDTVLVAIGYGSVFQVAGAGFIEGGLLYAGPSGGSPPVTGGLTQDFEHEILTSCKWIIVAGRALDSQTFVYEPHIPSRLVTAF